MKKTTKVLRANNVKTLSPEELARVTGGEGGKIEFPNLKLDGAATKVQSPS